MKKFKGQLDLGQYNEIVGSFEKESDRGVAIVAGSFVECYLKDFLAHFLLKDKTVEELFDAPFAPLSTFAARSKMCYAMKLITKTFYDDLEIIREIRNHFAHHPKLTSFTDSEVSARCKAFSLAKTFWGEGRTFMSVHGPRHTYLFSVGTCLGKMHNGLIARAERLAKPLDGMTNPTWGK